MEAIKIVAKVVRTTLVGGALRMLFFVALAGAFNLDIDGFMVIKSAFPGAALFFAKAIY